VARIGVDHEEERMAHSDLWPLARETLLALRAHYGPAIDHAAEKVGIPFGEWYGWLMAARIFEPDPVSAPRLHLRAAYTSPARLQEYLIKGVDLGLLEPVGAGEYRLTERGHAAIRRLIETAYGAMASLRPMDDDAAQRLVALLYHMIQAILAAPEPPGKWCLRTARHYDPGPGAPAMVRLDQYLSDLDAYRDDARLAAWHPYQTSGQVWETLTVLWRSGPLTLEELHGKLERRGYSREAYAEAAAELAARGWLAQDGNAYVLTAEGRALRDEAEATTDRYFYSPWACLNEAETAELRELLTQARDGLQGLPA
jgi:DNA-binding MarR family transcriptional regulator